MGNLIWHKVYNIQGHDQVGKIVATSDGGYLLAGFINNRALYLALRIDSLGNVLWTKTYGLQTSFASDAVQLPDGGFLLTGSSFVTSLNSHINVTRIDSVGNLVWSKKWDNTGNEGGRRMLKLNNNSFLISGYTNSPGWSTGGQGGFLLKIDQNGNTQRFITIDGPGEDFPYALRQKGPNEVLYGGYTNSPDTSNFDVWLMSLDTNLNLNWYRVYGDNDREVIQNIHTTPDGIRMTGVTESYGVPIRSSYFIQTDSIGQSGCFDTLFTPIVQTDSFTTGSVPFSTTSPVITGTTPVLLDSSLSPTQFIPCQTCVMNADFQPVAPSVCEGSTVNFTNTSTDAVGYEWWVDTVLVSTQTDFTYIATLPGSYQITLVAIAGSCSDTSNTTIIVNALPLINYSGLPQQMCTLATLVILSGTPSGGVFAGPGVFGNSFSPFLAGPGLASITYTYTDSAGCAATDTQTVLVNPSPTVSFTGLPTEMCENDTPVTLTGSPAGGTFAGGGITGNTFDPALAGSGIQVIGYTYSDSNNCAASDSQLVVINPLPTVSFSGLPPVICEDAAPVVLTGSPSGGAFTGSGVSGNTFSPGVSGPGTFEIQYSYADSNSCSASDTQTVTPARRVIHRL